MAGEAAGRGSRAPRPRVIDIESSDDKDALSLISYTQFLLPHKPQTAKPQKIKSEAPKLALRAGGRQIARFLEDVLRAVRTVEGRVTTAAVGIAITLWSIIKGSEFERTRLEVAAIRTARAPPSTADELHVYVERPELEDALESFLREPITAGGSYMVIVGPRGSGKSTLVSHVLSNMGEGVIVVPIDASTTASDLKAHILQEALIKYEPQSRSFYATSTPLEGKHLAERLKATARARGEEGWRPTLVLEITESGDSALVRSACTLLKGLTHDQPLCHGIIVLSSSFAVAELPDDGGRQRFLLVGAFSHGEASAHLDANFKAHLPEKVATVEAVAAAKERILPLTTLPKYVSAFMTEVLGSKSEQDLRARSEEWASAFEAAARRDVRGADINKLNNRIREESGQERRFPMRDLMRELLNAGAPVKLPTASFDLSASSFASTIRTSQEAKAVFHVDLVSKTVDFASGAHRKAAAELVAQAAAKVGTPAAAPASVGGLGTMDEGRVVAGLSKEEMMRMMNEMQKLLERE